MNIHGKRTRMFVDADSSWTAGNAHDAFFEIAGLLAFDSFDPLLVYSYVLLAATLHRVGDAMQAIERYSRLNPNDAFYALMRYRLAAIVAGEKKIARHERFVFLCNVHEERLICDISNTCSCVLREIESVVGKVFPYPFVIIDIDDEYYPVSLTDAIFSPAFP